MRLLPWKLAALLVSLSVGAAPAAVTAHPGKNFPDVISLPQGFRPEGITHGRGDTLYVANFEHGAIFEADARTGAVRTLVQPFTDRQGLGIKFDHRTSFLFVAGGGTGHGYVYDADSGASLADVQLAADPISEANPTFINDLVIARDALYFTDSFRPALYKLPLAHGGRLPRHPEVQIINLTGDFQFVTTNADGSRAFNSNGIEFTPDGRNLIIINSKTGLLYKVDPHSGVTEQIDVGGATFPAGDGLLLLGRTLYLAQNTNNIAVIDLDRHANHGKVVDNITKMDVPAFNILATMTFLDGAIYVTNPDFAVSDPMEVAKTVFTVARVPIE